MAYQYQQIKNITLPTGTTYSLKDAQAQLILAGFADAEGSVKAYIDQIADLAFDVIVLQTLPTADETAYNTYKNNLVLIPDEDAKETGAYIENVIVRTGTVGSYTYAWEPIGTTQVDLSEYLTDVSYTDATHTLSKTKNGTTSAVHQFGALADKSSATGEYTKPTGSGTVNVPTYESSNSDLLLVIENEDKEEFVQSVTAEKNSSAISVTATGGSVGTMTTVDTSKFTQAQLTTKNYGFSSSQEVLSSAEVQNETLILGKVTAGTQDVLSDAVFGNDFASNGTAPTFPTYSVPANTVVVDVDDSDKAEALIDANLSTDDGSSTSKSVSVTTDVVPGEEPETLTVTVGTTPDTVSVS